MKPEIHPEYRDVVFLDTQNGTSFITRSTMKTQRRPTSMVSSTR
jgi:ribosomal protein L31